MSIYEIVTQRILSRLEAGVVPWRKTWTTGLPKSLTTGKEYRGLNILVLGTAEFTSRYWLTYRQALQSGGHVRKGERATPVVYWKWRTEKELKQLELKTGKRDLARCFPFGSAVFNLDQVEGVSRPVDDVPQQPNHRLELAEQVFHTMTDLPAIIHAAGAEPAYYRQLDRITLPHLTQFENAEEYYAALFHELVHSTAHGKRLNRFAEAEGSQPDRYSFEELVAEFGAAFLCAWSGITQPDKEARQADYIAGWAKVLRNDHRMIVLAAAAAQRAADYIRAISPAKELSTSSAGQPGEKRAFAEGGVPVVVSFSRS